MSKPAKVETLSFEAAMEELEQIVRRLESGDGKLDDAVSAYERGVALKRRLDALLGDAEARIEKIRLGNDGQPAGTEPLES
ncbi:MAG: exodeoxyribonuclease VII small subunit [Alphaproteobacteria bacterium]